MIELMLFLVVSTFTPGPNNLLSMQLAIQSNMKAVAQYILATFFGFLIVLNVTGFGNLFISQKFPFLTDVVKYIGFVFMLYLAYKIFKNSGPIEEGQKPNVTWVYGFTLQFVNPKIWLAGLTVYSVYIFEFSKEPDIIFLSALGMSLIGVASQFLWALLGLAIKKYYNKHHRIINTIMSLLLVYLAFSILI